MDLRLHAADEPTIAAAGGRTTRSGDENCGEAVYAGSQPGCLIIGAMQSCFAARSPSA